MNVYLTKYAYSASALIRLCLLFLIFATSGCVSTKYSQDYNPETNFSNLKTYDWRTSSSEIVGINLQQLQQLADQQLARQGYTRSEDEPDLLFDMTVATRTRSDSSTGIGLSLGIPLGRHANIGVGGGKSLPRDKQEGIVLVDVNARETNQLIWRGSAEGIPLKNFSLGSEQKLADILRQLLSQYPPK